MISMYVDEVNRKHIFDDFIKNKNNVKYKPRFKTDSN